LTPEVISTLCLRGAPLDGVSLSKRLILIEAPSSAYRRGMLALGKQPEEEEETFYVGADVKLFLSSLRATTVPRALACVRLISLKPPSIRVGLLPPNT
jgi:hypothetical protein